MNVGLDIDGTITAEPEMFSILSRGLKEKGHNVYILTFRHEEYRDSTEAELKEMGIVHDGLYMGENIIDLALKAKIAKELNLDILFEDNEDVLRTMPKSVRCISVWPKQF